MSKVLVLGAGVNGLTCALRIKEKYPNVDVTIIGSELTPNTTGDGSGGLWLPYLSSNTPPHLISKWGMESFRKLHEYWVQGGYDVCLMPVYELYRPGNAGTIPMGWHNDVYGFRTLDKRHLDYVNDLYSANYISGTIFTTFKVVTNTLLRRYMERLRELNVRIIRDSVTSLLDPQYDGYDVVVNCLGLGARDVVPDERVRPVRGQIAKVHAPWINYTIQDKSTGHYIIPNDVECILGGTGQIDNFNIQVDEKDSDFILSGCEKIFPSLKNATLVSQWAGLRPGRDQVRLEAEIINNKLYIHNYGHGGSGFTLFWGCAGDVVDLYEKHTKRNTSKL
ncbi:unnamed protein product [Leptidea sinapis]|uniref:FAD dependent oxidoreductase domain-containing protein n=1 Tax=Leptidea sinapis TaxID=189913 RepID=A0A5E4QLM8_9NEOP|nr:unnamed protein product [Leptidea sinapis]